MQVCGFLPQFRHTTGLNQSLGLVVLGLIVGGVLCLSLQGATETLIRMKQGLMMNGRQSNPEFVKQIDLGVWL